MRLFLCPANLNVRDLIIERNRKHLKYYDRYMYIIHRVTVESINRKEDFEGVRLNKSLLASILGSAIGAEILGNLIHWQVLERFGNYRVGRRSYKYQLSSQYQDSAIVYYLPTDGALLYKLKSPKSQRLSELHSYLKSNLHQLTFDWNQLEYELHWLGVNPELTLYKIVKQLCQAQSQNSCVDVLRTKMEQGEGESGTPPYDFNFTGVNEINKASKNNYFLGSDAADEGRGLAILYSVYSILVGDIYFLANKELGRVYSNVTNLKRELKVALRLKDGRQLIEIDIKNSQPFFLAVLMLQQFGDANCLVPEDVMRFAKIVESGRLYEYLLDLWTDLNSREAAKKKFITYVLFCRNVVSSRNKHFMKFQEEFPNVAQFIIEHKSVNHRDLAVLLQREESKFMIEYIGGHFLQREWCFVTIHDSALMLEDSIPGFRRYSDEYFSIQGISPMYEQSN